MIPLFEHFPTLAEKLAYVSLGNFPTPAPRLERLGGELGIDRLYVKQDSLSARVYGGNKIRKLEFLVGKALQQHAGEILTFGYAGSNHALATAVCAEQVGLRGISMLLPQPNAHYVRRNLLMGLHCRAELHQRANVATLAAETVQQLLGHKLTTGTFPLIVPPGGSSPVGTIGYVNAAFELKEQILAGELPAPDRIYVALGSLGTAAGLVLGLKAAGLATRVVPVAIVHPSMAGKASLLRLARRTNALLRKLDPSFPSVELAGNEVEIRYEFFGHRYAGFTEEGMAAVSRMYDGEGIKLDGTYTGKTLAALMRDAGDARITGETVLFWNTYNGRDLSAVTDTIDYRKLPACFHRYFEEDVQSLDTSA